MRYVLLGAVLLVLVIGGLVLGLILAPISLQELRDVVVIIYGLAGIVLVLVLLMVAVGLLLAMRALQRTVGTALDEQVRPVMDEVQATARNMRGASEFITDSAVHPLIRVLSVGRGVRRGIARVTGLARRER